MGNSWAIFALLPGFWYYHTIFPRILNFDIAFVAGKAQHLLDLAQKVGTRRTQWLRNQVLVELFWRPSL
jgi:hypothetical protein